MKVLGWQLKFGRSGDMISTKNLSGLPNVNCLKAFCKGLAALDIIMLEEPEGKRDVPATPELGNRE